jgi:ankyrin repeat protein
MHAAGYNLNPRVITILLKAGADTNDRDKNGETALMWAAQYNNNHEVIAALLNAGADTKAKDNKGKTAFDYARINARLKTVDYRQLQEASR